MMRVYLIGYMGSGKTTLGKAFAQELGFTFIDLDLFIEARYHKSISTLFKELGESEFRRVERNVLHEVSEFEDTVISCGGGTPCFFDNVDYMNSKGFTIFLDASVEVLYRRLRIAKINRPLIAKMSDEKLFSFINENLDERKSSYRLARYTFNASYLETIDQISESVQELKSLLNFN